MSKFTAAVSWLYHHEPVALVRDELGYTGDLAPVYAVVELLRELGAEEDTVSLWASEN